MSQTKSFQANQILDCKGLACPMPIVKTKKTITGMQDGEVLEIQATDKGSLADLQAWSKSAGHHYIGTLTEGDLLRHYVRKATASEAKEPPKHEYKLSNEELERMIDGGEKLFVLDVREPAEYAFGHIPGAVSIPLGELEARWNELSKEDQIYVICRTGTRSDLACRQLAEKGFDKTVNILPGMSEWHGPVRGE
ncbi:sulfurtransferase TusA family protein [Paenibacillus sp. HB172176]|uniref:sulfurtransferase TusA family protein n=1 Tax=Paenibacillus sp. HB172176 TaxID=2493690 RepID=UPI00143A699C|nr:sulfurtransferase TusA family protein [Paenibacillus sp. HB172176]